MHRAIRATKTLIFPDISHRFIILTRDVAFRVILATITQKFCVIAKFVPRCGGRCTAAATESENEDEDRITIPARHGVAGIGDLYNIGKGTFCSASVFHGELPESAIRTIPIWSISMSQGQENLNKKSNIRTNTGKQLALNAASWSRKYNKTGNTGNQTTETTFENTVFTQVVSLNLYHDEVKGRVNHEAIALTGATHVVEEVHFGFSQNLKFMSEQRNEQRMENMTTEADYARLESTDGLKTEDNKTIGRYDSTEETSKDSTCMNEEFIFQASGVKLQGEFNLPSSAKEAKETMGHALQMSSHDDQKGVPQMYVLRSLRSGGLKEYYGTSEDTAKAIDASFHACRIKREVNEMIGLDTSSLCLENEYDNARFMVQEMEKYEQCVPLEDIAEARSFLRKLDNAEKAMRHGYYDICDGISPETEQMSAKEVEAFAQEVSDIYEASKPKLKFAKLCDECGVQYVDK